MDATLFKKIKTLAGTLGCKWRLFTESSLIIDVKNDSSHCIFDDTDNVIYALRTNENNQFDNKPFRLSIIDYNHIEMINFDMSKENVSTFLAGLTLTEQEKTDIAGFIASTTQLTYSDAKNFNEELDEEGNPINKFTRPTVTMGK